MNTTIDALIRTIFVIAVILLYKNWSKIAAAYRRQSSKYEKFVGVINDILGLFKIRINNFFLSIVLPMLLIGGVWTYIFSFGARPAPPEPGIINLLNAVIITPIYEEIMFRGLILGVCFLIFFWLAFKVLKWKETKISKLNINITALLIVSIIFSIAHKGVLDFRYISGVIFGVVYLIDNKNLLPAIIGHSLNNLIVVIAHG